MVEQARAKELTRDEHFTVDGTLLEAWAGAKSFQAKDKKQAPPDDRTTPAIPRQAFTASSGRTKPMPRRPTRRRCWRATERARSRS